MKPPQRRPHVRLQSRIKPAIAQRLHEFAAATGTTETAVVEAALGQYLDRTSDTTLMLRRLDRLARAGDRTQRDLELLSQAFSIWIKLWFAHTPSVAEDAKPAARMSAESRYRQFVDHLAEQFSGGRRFLDDLPRESMADEAELSTIAQTASAPSTGSPPPERSNAG